MEALNDIIERAFELARSGSCRHSSDIRRRLRMEGFRHVDLFISGPGLEADLDRRCRMAGECRVEPCRVPDHSLAH